MFGSKLNASHIPFNLNFTVENFLLAGDAGSLTQILCSLMNYFVSDLGLIPAQLTVEEAPALFFLSLSLFFFFLNEPVFGPFGTWCLIQLLCQKRCGFMFPPPCWYFGDYGISRNLGRSSRFDFWLTLEICHKCLPMHNMHTHHHYWSSAAWLGVLYSGESTVTLYYTYNVSYVCYEWVVLLSMFGGAHWNKFHSFNIDMAIKTLEFVLKDVICNIYAWC